MTGKFFQINAKHHTLDRGSSENNTKNLGISYTNFRKSKIKKQILKEAGGEKSTFPTEERN